MRYRIDICPVYLPSNAKKVPVVLYWISPFIESSSSLSQLRCDIYLCVKIVFSVCGAAEETRVEHYHGKSFRVSTAGGSWSKVFQVSRHVRRTCAEKQRENKKKNRKGSSRRAEFAEEEKFGCNQWRREHRDSDRVNRLLKGRRDR